MRRPVLVDRRLERVNVCIAEHVRPNCLQAPQEGLRRLRLLPLARIFVERILNDRMNGSLLPRRELMRQIAGAGGTD